MPFTLFNYIYFYFSKLPNLPSEPQYARRFDKSIGARRRCERRSKPSGGLLSNRFRGPELKFPLNGFCNGTPHAVILRRLQFGWIARTARGALFGGWLCCLPSRSGRNSRKCSREGAPNGIADEDAQTALQERAELRTWKSDQYDASDPFIVTDLLILYHRILLVSNLINLI